MSANYIPQKTLQDYKLEKIDILEQMRIYLRTDEMKHLMTLESAHDVDRYARTLIMNKL